MKKINNLRAKLIYDEYKSGDCGATLSDIFDRFLRTCPSITEIGECDRKGCRSNEHDLKFASVSIPESAFNGNMANLKQAIDAALPPEPRCLKCRHPFGKVQRETGNHFFVEVIQDEHTKHKNSAICYICFTDAENF